MNTSKWKTTAAYISGAICGKLWMPSIMAGTLLKSDLRGHWGCFDKGDTFREALNSLLMHKGGDFRNALFSADTVLRIERKRSTAKGYEVHVWERELASLCTCKDLINPDAFTGDFCGQYD